MNRARLFAAVKRITPEPIVDRVRQMFFSRIREIDLQYVEKLRAADLADLTVPAKLEHRLLPDLGLNDELLHEFPA